MTTTAGRRRAEPAKRPPGPAKLLGAIAAGVVVASLCWFLLVLAAIDFGGEARNGNSTAWVLMVAASAGAIGCLVLVMLLGNKALSAIGLAKDPSTRHGSHTGPHGHRHAGHSSNHSAGHSAGHSASHSAGHSSGHSSGK